MAIGNDVSAATSSSQPFYNGVINGLQSVLISSIISYPNKVSDPETWTITPTWTNLS